jgi:hypothetical protein
MNARLLAVALVGMGTSIGGVFTIACGSTDASPSSANSDAGADASKNDTSAQCPSPAVGRQENGGCAALGQYGTDPSRSPLCCYPCKADEVVVQLGNPTCVQKDSGTSKDGGACGLVLFPPDLPAQCQTELDKICCNEEKACGDDPACAAAVECMGKCPVPRKDSCIAACNPGGSAQAALEAVSTCSKNPSFDPDGGTRCSYP